MDSKQFKRIIQYEELAKTDDSFKFILKAYLMCPLKGNKIKELCYLRSVGRMTDPQTIGTALHEDSPLTFNALPLKVEIEAHTLQLVELFKKIKKDGLWTVEEEEHKCFDVNGKLIDLESYELLPIITKEVLIRKTTTYYLGNKKLIQPIGGKE